MIVVSLEGLKLRLIDYRECGNEVFRQHHQAIGHSFVNELTK